MFDSFECRIGTDSNGKRYVRMVDVVSDWGKALDVVSVRRHSLSFWKM